MAPGPFSGLLAPFIGARKSKKYEKLQTEDPEKKRQEATQDEINRLHSKIVSLYLFDTHSVHTRGFPISIRTQTQGQYRCQKVRKILKNHLPVSDFATMLLD